MSADLQDDSHHWMDGDAGPVVRSFAVTRGRVPHAIGDFDLLAFVVATIPDHAVEAGLQPEHHAIVAVSWEPISVVDLASRLNMGVGVVRVLLADLRAVGMISLYKPPAAEEPHDLDILKAVVNGLRAL